MVGIVVAPVPPRATAIVEALQVPVVIVPTEVRLDAVTPEASVAPDRLPAGAAPFSVAVIVPALKLPEASRATMVLAVLAFVAVVALLLTFPAVLMVASLVSAMAAVALISALTMTPAPIAVAMLAPVDRSVDTDPVTSP